jgi:hypothetical protein
VVWAVGRRTLLLPIFTEFWVSLFGVVRLRERERSHWPSLRFKRRQPKPILHDRKRAHYKLSCSSISPSHCYVSGTKTSSEEGSVLAEGQLSNHNPIMTPWSGTAAVLRCCGAAATRQTCRHLYYFDDNINSMECSGDNNIKAHDTHDESRESVRGWGICIRQLCLNLSGTYALLIANYSLVFKPRLAVTISVDLLPRKHGCGSPVLLTVSCKRTCKLLYRRPYTAFPRQMLPQRWSYHVRIVDQSIVSWLKTRWPIVLYSHAIYQHLVWIRWTDWIRKHGNFTGLYICRCGQGKDAFFRRSLFVSELEAQSYRRRQGVLGSSSVRWGRQHSAICREC